VYNCSARVGARLRPDYVLEGSVSPDGATPSFADNCLVEVASANNGTNHPCFAEI